MEESYPADLKATLILHKKKNTYLLLFKTLILGGVYLLRSVADPN